MDTTLAPLKMPSDKDEKVKVSVESEDEIDRAAKLFVEPEPVDENKKLPDLPRLDGLLVGQQIPREFSTDPEARALMTAAERGNLYEMRDIMAKMTRARCSAVIDYLQLCIYQQCNTEVKAHLWAAKKAQYVLTERAFAAACQTHFSAEFAALVKRRTKEEKKKTAAACTDPVAKASSSATEASTPYEEKKEATGVQDSDDDDDDDELLNTPLAKLFDVSPMASKVWQPCTPLGPLLRHGDNEYNELVFRHFSRWRIEGNYPESSRFRNLIKAHDMISGVQSLIESGDIEHALRASKMEPDQYGTPLSDVHSIVSLTLCADNVLEAANDFGAVAESLRHCHREGIRYEALLEQIASAGDQMLLPLTIVHKIVRSSLDYSRTKSLLGLLLELVRTELRLLQDGSLQFHKALGLYVDVYTHKRSELFQMISKRAISRAEAAAILKSKYGIDEDTIISPEAFRGQSLAFVLASGKQVKGQRLSVEDIKLQKQTYPSVASVGARLKELEEAKTRFRGLDDEKATETISSVVRAFQKAFPKASVKGIDDIKFPLTAEATCRLQILNMRFIRLNDLIGQAREGIEERSKSDVRLKFIREMIPYAQDPLLCAGEDVWKKIEKEGEQQLEITKKRRSRLRRKDARAEKAEQELAKILSIEAEEAFPLEEDIAARLPSHLKPFAESFSCVLFPLSEDDEAEAEKSGGADGEISKAGAVFIDPVPMMDSKEEDEIDKALAAASDIDMEVSEPDETSPPSRKRKLTENAEGSEDEHEDARIRFRKRVKAIAQYLERKEMAETAVAEDAEEAEEAEEADSQGRFDQTGLSEAANSEGLEDASQEDDPDYDPDKTETEKDLSEADAEPVNDVADNELEDVVMTADADQDPERTETDEDLPQATRHVPVDQDGDVRME